jgi:hypothetical protein
MASPSNGSSHNNNNKNPTPATKMSKQPHVDHATAAKKRKHEDEEATMPKVQKTSSNPGKQRVVSNEPKNKQSTPQHAQGNSQQQKQQQPSKAKQQQPQQVISNNTVPSSVARSPASSPKTKQPQTDEKKQQKANVVPQKKQQPQPQPQPAKKQEKQVVVEDEIDEDEDFDEVDQDFDEEDGIDENEAFEEDDKKQKTDADNISTIDDVSQQLAIDGTLKNECRKRNYFRVFISESFHFLSLFTHSHTDSSNSLLLPFNMTDQSFDSLAISDLTKKSLKEMSFTKMTEIQAKSIPHLLQAKDLLGKAKTGSGKTLAFVIPAIEVLIQNHFSLNKGK